MTPADFRDLVSRMRAAQRDYFRSRSPAALRLSIDLERQVDAELRSEPGLFDDPVAHG
jgi:hypothetical protein